jgi:hypothetical protein
MKESYQAPAATRRSDLRIHTFGSLILSFNGQLPACLRNTLDAEENRAELWPERTIEY